MRTKSKVLALSLALALASWPAAAVVKTASWTWPTARTDGTTLPLTAIGAATIYDTSVPVPGAPGTVVPCTLTFPPTTPTASCSVNVIGGHSFVLTVSDNATPPDVSGVSNSVTVPLSVPVAVTNFAIQ